MTRANTGIMVVAPNAGQAYETALGYGFQFTRSQGTQVTRIDNPEGRCYTLNTIRVKGHDVMTPTNTQPGS